MLKKMVALFVAATLCSLVHSLNVLDFHKEYLQKIVKTNSQYVHLGANECPKYVCNTKASFENSVCSFPINSTYIELEGCAVSGDYCPTVLDPTFNSTCSSTPPKPFSNGNPGDACEVKNDCGSPLNTCVGYICQGLQEGDFCNDQPDCEVGLGCDHKTYGGKNSTCQPQLQTREPCSSYLRDAYCTNGDSCTLGTCQKSFQKQNGEFVTTYSASTACNSGFYMPHPVQTDISFCAEPPRSPNVQLPIRCELGSMCTSMDGQYQMACQCGINPTGQGFCPLFPGDDPYTNFVDAMKEYLSNPNIGSCHFLDVGQQLCGASVDVYQALIQSQLEIQWFVSKQDNTDCIKKTYTADYWDAAINP